MDYKELKLENERLKAEIDSYHLFYEDFNKFDVAISSGNGLLADMYSAVIGAKKSGKNSDKVAEQEERLKKLFGILEVMQGLNNKAHSLNLRFKHLHQDNFGLRAELNAMKEAFNQK